MRRADHPSVGLILDSFHTLARRIDPQTICRIPSDRIFFVQLAAALDRVCEERTGRRSGRVAVGPKSDVRVA